MPKPALTCKVKVSGSLYAEWLVSEHPEQWQWQDGQAVQQWTLVGKYRAPRGLKGKGTEWWANTMLFMPRRLSPIGDTDAKC